MHASKCSHCANSNLMSFDFEFDVNESSNDSPQKNNWPFNNGVKYCESKTRDGRFQQLQAVSNFCETIVQLNEKINIIKKHIYVKKGASEILQQSEGKPKCNLSCCCSSMLVRIANTSNRMRYIQTFYDTITVRINVSWFGKYDPFFKFHDANFPKRRNFFSTAVKNNFNMPGVDKSRTCVRYVLEIINFTYCRLDYFLTSTFTNKTFQFPEY